MSEQIVVAITGASGAQYGLRLLQCLAKTEAEIHCLISEAARVVINTETPLLLPDDSEEARLVLESYSKATPGQFQVYGHKDWMSPVASGSGAPGKMVICPCSAGTLSSVSAGSSNNLIERAADVILKERGQLILVPRETPYSEIHLENMLKLTRMGAVIVPASPGFYHRPETVDDLIDFIVARVLTQLGIEQGLLPRWGE